MFKKTALFLRDGFPNAIIGQDNVCNTVYDNKCETVYETVYEDACTAQFSTIYEKKCETK